VPDLPPASLIVSTRNRPEFLSDLIDSVFGGTERPAEIVVVDQSDGPHPGLVDAQSDGPTRVRYVFSPERGLSRGRNAGISAATTEILAFADDDMLASREWFGALIHALLSAPPRSVVVGQVLPGVGESPGSFAPSTRGDRNPAVYSGRVDTDVVSAGNMAIRRSAFADIGPFDERLGPGTRFPSSEDNDLGFRLLEAGYRVVYAPGATLTHRSWRRAEDWIPLRWSYGRGQGAYFAKHASFRDRYMLRRLGHDLARHLLGSIGAARRDPRRAVGDFVYALALVVGAAEWSLTQKRSS
jgi:GT2 family glycosyltransferase